MIQAILFDFNGVIIDDEGLQLKAYREALDAEGVTLTDEDYYGSLGMDDATFLRSIYEKAGKELNDETMRSLIAKRWEIHRHLYGDELPLFPGVVTFIKALARVYPLGLVSMARREEIDYVLERATLKSYFSIIVSAEEERPCKPDPYCYRRALELLNERRSEAHVLPLRADECLVIEDSPPGIKSARAAGMRTLGVANTVSEKALREADADVVTHSLADWTTDALHHVYNKR
ncbi:MAG TPA: HAD family phosphatase [Pyrinomonadaceae bacterium]|jgi:HAD superfamily hydrolase (TIGR01509 family)